MSLRTEYTLSSATFGDWIPLNIRQCPFNVSVAVDLNSAASGITYDVEHTFDNIWEKIIPSALTRVTTTATLTFRAAHGLNIGDWIQVHGASAPFDGTFSVVSVPSTTTLTYTVTDSGATSGSVNGYYVNKARVFDNDILQAETTSNDGNYAFPIKAVRLNVTAYSAGTATFFVHQGQ